MRAVERWLYLLVAAWMTLAAARAFYGYMLVQTGGEWAAPLDDVFKNVMAGFTAAATGANPTTTGTGTNADDNSTSTGTGTGTSTGGGTGTGGSG